MVGMGADLYASSRPSNVAGAGDKRIIQSKRRDSGESAGKNEGVEERINPLSTDPSVVL
jgi:hypothetical protein